MFDSMSDQELIKEFKKCCNHHGLCEKTGKIKSVCYPYLDELESRGYAITGDGVVTKKEDLI